MTSPLWTWDDLVAATGGTADGSSASTVTGFSIDTRTLQPGDVFVALKDVRDGHDFVPGAFKAGAAAALVRKDYARKDGDGALIRVDDPLAALGGIAKAARARLAPAARVIAITGSAGKTGTKEMLRACLAPLGKTHAPEKSFNNHWGVPLTLARMPADTAFAVIEIGMNHAGEITPLTEMTTPHVAIVTNVLPVHVGNFTSPPHVGIVGVAHAKAEIFAGLLPTGLAVLPGDSPHIAVLAKAAEGGRGRRIVTFGRGAVDVRATRIGPSDGGSRVDIALRGATASYVVGAPGDHLAENSLAVVAALSELFGTTDLSARLAPLAAFRAPAGRGARSVLRVAGGDLLLIDESYNANPASMRAALAMLAEVPRDRFPRRIAVLGDMRELGTDSSRFHRDLIDPVEGSGADFVFACGPYMHEMFEGLAPARRGGWAATSADLVPKLIAALEPGDAVMVKGSLGTNMAPLVSAIRSLDAAAGTAKA